jgi:lipopolysaccharide/colanic/teichoic acid biosynthesis glycosyltransferase
MAMSNSLGVSPAGGGDDLRERLIRRYAHGASAHWTARARVKTWAWRSVIGATHAVKRGLDLAGGTVLLLALSPGLALIALLGWLDSRGPIFFRRIRVGRWGRPFAMWKFRSMYVDAEARRAHPAGPEPDGRGVIFKMKRDPRVIRVGRFIRKASIDELPQLWNVVAGDMSLVGPRPPLPSEVAAYTLADRRRRSRLSWRPSTPAPGRPVLTWPGFSGEPGPVHLERVAGAAEPRPVGSRHRRTAS